LYDKISGHNTAKLMAIWVKSLRFNPGSCYDVVLQPYRESSANNSN